MKPQRGVLVPATPTVIKEKQDCESQRGDGKQDQAYVTGDHEVTHNQGHFVLVDPVPLCGRRWVVAASHGKKLCGGGGGSRVSTKLPPYPAGHPILAVKSCSLAQTTSDTFNSPAWLKTHCPQFKSLLLPTRPSQTQSGVSVSKATRD
ncbi:hypothetical protein FKM82_014155 [Ascaphus truei]